MGWHRSTAIAVRLALLLAVLPLAAAAQESGLAPATRANQADAAAAPSNATPSARVASGMIDEVKPEVFYLKDKEGNLQAVPGFSFEEFVKLYRLKNQLEQPEAEPPYSLQRMTISGTAQADRAELSVELKVLVNETGWVRIPLRLPKAVLREPATYTGPGETFVHFDEATGYVAWLRGAAGTEHRLTLKIAAPLSTLGSGRRLELAMPRATTSQMTFRVPIARAVGAVSQGATLDVAQADGAGTRFTVLGVSGDFSLTWHEPDAQVALVPVVLEVNAATVVTLDERQVRTDATLTVRSLGGEFDFFRVRLPQGAKLVPGLATNGYKLEPDAGDPTRIVDVRLDRKTAGPVEVIISTQQNSDLSQADEWLNLAGLEVPEAMQQAGHIAVCVVGDWQVVWGPRRGVRQVDDLPESLRRKDLAAGFEYFHRAGESSSLPARIVRRKTRIAVEPSYLALVEKGDVRLEAKLKYTVRGAKVSRLEIDAPGWEIDDIGPKNLVDVDEALASEPPRLLVPLQTPTSGEFEIVLKAHRATHEGQPVEVSFPRATADLPGPTEIVILPADSVELTPRAESFAGLTRQLATPTMKLPERQQEPLLFRGEPQLAKFVADVQTHPQTITTQIFSQMHIGYQATRVEQRLTYRVSYEPIDRIVLEVPRALAVSGRLEVTADGQRLQWVGQSEESNLDGVALARMAYALGKQRIGRFEVLLRYSLPQERLSPESAGDLSLGLVMPIDGELTGNELAVTAEQGMRIEPRGSAWAMTDDAERSSVRLRAGAVGPAPSTLYLAAKGKAPLVDITVQFDSARASTLTVVERVWIQTWLSEGRRQDRAAYRITSSEPRVRLKLPTGALPSETEVLLDGVAVPPTIMPDDDLAIEWPEETPQRPHVLEVRYQFAEPGKAAGQIALESPQVQGSTWVQRTYWQLVLPPTEHVLSESGNWTGEYTWGWRRFGWGRVPLLDQLQLETWAGATHQTALPEGSNQYVFSAAGPTARLAVWTAGRSLIVFTSSLTVLTIGLLLIYVARCRHPACFFGAAVVLAAFGMLLPEATVLLAQAGSMGVILAIGAALWARSVTKRRPRSVVVRGGATSSIERTHSPARIPRTIGLGSHSSTTTEPVGLQASAPESNS